MPLHVDIRINDDPIETLHIGRLKGDTNSDSENVYVATFEGSDVEPNWFSEDAATFTHRYGDGAVVCVQKALNAILK